MRIKVVWLRGTSFAFYDNTKDAYKQVVSLKSVGFTDAAIDWANSSV